MPMRRFQEMKANLEFLFYDDFTGAKWQVDDEIREITWSTVTNSLKLPSGKYVGVTASLEDYLGQIRKAFEVWDHAIESIKFVETNDGNSADVTIAATDIDGYGGLNGYWNYNWDGNKHILEGTIQFDRLDLNDGWFLTTAMHEIGNILGLGDLAVSGNYKSVQEDPFPRKFNANNLWAYDKHLILQVYPKIIGSSKKDRLTGTNEADEIFGLGGNDVIKGKKGDDIIDPGLWTTGKFDVVKGGKGADTFVVKDGYWAFIKDFKFFEDRLDVAGLSKGLDWEIRGSKTYIYGDNGSEVARMKGKFNLDEARFN